MITGTNVSCFVIFYGLDREARRHIQMLRRTATINATQLTPIGIV